MAKADLQHPGIHGRKATKLTRLKSNSSFLLNYVVTKFYYTEQLKINIIEKNTLKVKIMGYLWNNLIHYI